jgi:predicted amidohydrolase
MENTCFVASANRCGEETVNGKAMAGDLGNSVICGPHGDLVVAARPESTFLLADCVPTDDGETHPLGSR